MLEVCLSESHGRKMTSETTSILLSSVIAIHPYLIDLHTFKIVVM
jgi:hypothetical protein